MLVIDMSQFFHMDRTQMSSSKLFSIMRVEIQVNVKKKKKKAYESKWQRAYDSK